MNAAIAQHLNIAETAIVRIEEWANVLFVVCKKLGARFVSKKVVEVKTVTDNVLFARETSIGLLEAIKTDDGVDIKISSQSILLTHKNTKFQLVPNTKDWQVARDKGFTYLAFDPRYKKNIALTESEFDLIKAYQKELAAKKPKSIDDLIVNYNQLSLGVSSLQNAIIDAKEAHYDRGIPTPANTDRMDSELKLAIEKLNTFVAGNPTVIAEIKNRETAQVKRFLAYD